jgi:hypothetical protein
MQDNFRLFLGFNQNATPSKKTKHGGLNTVETDSLVEAQKWTRQVENLGSQNY